VYGIVAVLVAQVVEYSVQLVTLGYAVTLTLEVGTVQVEVSVQLSVTRTGLNVSMTFVTQIWTGYDVVIHVGVEVVMTVVSVCTAVFVATPEMTVVLLSHTVLDSTMGIVL
jgi:hypothetical protein